MFDKKALLALLKGNLFSQLLPLFITPILTRLYTPEEFGLYSLYISIVAILVIISTARYELAIVLPKDEKSSINLLVISIMISLLTSFFLAVILFFYKEKLFYILNANQFEKIWFLFPMAMLFSGIVQSFLFWFNRKKYFKDISSAQIFQSGTISIFQLFFGFLHQGFGLIFSNPIGRFFVAIFYIRRFILKDFSYLKMIDIKSFKSLLYKYKDFPLINSWHAFSDIIRNSGVVFLISSFYGSLVLGYFMISLKILQLPISVVSIAIGQILYQKFSTIEDANLLNNYLKKIVFWLAIASIVIYFILYILSLYSRFILGDSWDELTKYIEILLPVFFIRFILSPLSNIPIILNQQKKFFLINLSINIFLPFQIYLLYKIGLDIFMILTIYSYTTFLSYTMVLLWIYKISKKTKRVYEDSDYR